jgi:hypothetical protein
MLATPLRQGRFGAEGDVTVAHHATRKALSWMCANHVPSALHAFFGSSMG